MTIEMPGQAVSRLRKKCGLRFLAAAGLLALIGLPGLALAQDITVSPTTLTINEGSSGTITVTRGSITGTVVIDIHGDVDVSPDDDSKTMYSGSNSITFTISAPQDADSLSEVDRFSVNSTNTSVNVYATILDDDDSTGPTVASGSGYFSNSGATTTLTGPVKGGADIYTKVVFGELVNHFQSNTSSARPDIRYKIGTGSGSGTQFSIVPSSESLDSGDCRVVDTEGTETNGDTPSTTYVCRYKTTNTDSGDFGFLVGTNTTDLKDNAASAYTHSAKIKIDTTAPTVSSAAYYSDAATSKALTGTVKGGTPIYTKVTFSEKVTHTAGNGASARPEINYSVGGSSTQYDIVANTATLASGDCKPGAAPLASVYVCRYDVGGSDSGSLGFEVDTGTTDEPGNALAAAWTPSTTLTLEPAPVFSTTVADQRLDKGYAYSMTLPAATGGDTGTTLRYSLSPALPTGLVFNAATRTISGTPTANTTRAEYTYTVTETDGDSNSLKFDLWVRTKFELIAPKSARVTEGSDGTITLRLSAQPAGNVTVTMSQVTLDEVTAVPGNNNAGLVRTLTPQNWNTGVTYTVRAPEDNDHLSEQDWIDFDPEGQGLSGSDFKSVLVTVVDNDNTNPPTVTSASSGYYDNANATGTPLSGNLGSGMKIYTKITFSENLKHDARNDFRETPHISYKIGAARAVRYDILDYSGTLTDGACKPDHATNRNVYICQYTTVSGDYGKFDFRVGRQTEDLAGQRLANPYTHATKLDVDARVLKRSSATVNGNKLVLTFNNNLDRYSVPVASAFTVNTGSPSVSSIAFSGKTATLTLASAVTEGATVTLSFIQPTINKLKDTSGNAAASFSGISVTNNTDSTPPTLTTAVATGITITLTFSENLDENSDPGPRVFSVDVANTDDDPSVYDRTMKGNTIVLKLATAVKASDSLTVSYNKPTDANATVLQDLVGNDLAQITDRAVTNSTTDLIVLNKTSLTINESGSGNTGTFTVKLGSQPAGDVAVAVTIKGDPPGRMDDNILDFDENTWSTAQTVTVTGQKDANDWDDTATIHLTASQGRLKEERLGSATIALTVTDTASRNALEITPESFSINEGSSATMSVRLTKKPSSEVFVRISRNEEHDGLSLSPAQLVFTPSNYKTRQFFTLHAEEDADTDDEQFLVNLRSSGGGYDYESPSLSVRTVDTGSGNAIVVDPPVLLNVPEGGSATATVKLSNAPTGDVTVSVALGTEPTNSLSVSPTSLTFTSSNYANAQTITFSDSGDANSVDERVVATLSASGGGYAGKSLNFELVSEDDELSDPETPPTVSSIVALDNENDPVPFEDTIPLDSKSSPYRLLPPLGKIKVTFSKPVGKCDLTTEPVCSTDVTAWTSSIDIDSAHAAKLFELVRLGFLDTGEKRNVPFTVTAVSGNDVTIAPTGLNPTIYDDEPKLVRLIVRDKYWSVDGGVQGASVAATWEVKSPPAVIPGLVLAQSNSTPDNSTLAGLVGQTLNIWHESSQATGCLDVQWAKASNGQNVQTWECNGTVAQDWRLEQRSSGPEAGRYRLVSGVGGGNSYCLDNRGDFSDSDRMGIWSCLTDDHHHVVNQTVDIAPAPNGDAWTLTFTRGNASSVMWAERDNDNPKGNVGQRSGGTGARAEWQIGTYTPSLNVSVADASVDEGPSAELAFTVSLDRAVTSADGTVSVDYATRDVTASAGADYTSTSGTLTFAVGEQDKTVNVTVLEDSHDDDGETLELVLSNATGASISDGTGTGTITNADPVPQAWLGRFGRSLSTQVLGGVRERRETARTPGDETVTLGGQALSFSGGTECGTFSVTPDKAVRGLDGQPLSFSGSADTTGSAVSGAATFDVATPDTAASDTVTSDTAAFNTAACGTLAAAPAANADILSGAAGWYAFDPHALNLHDGLDPYDRSMNQSRTLSARDLLLGASFALTGEQDEAGGTLAWWGRVAESRFEGQEGLLNLDGSLTTGLVGADYARNNWLAGMMLTWTDAKGDYRHDTTSSGQGALDASLLAGTVYGSLQATERLELWGAAGHGQGELTLTLPTGPGSKTDMDWLLAAAGARGTLLAPTATRSLTLALVADALWTRTTSDETVGLAAAQADVTQLRLGVEGGWSVSLAGGELAPTVELGLRHDGGDAETGLGVELGGGLAWHHPGWGLSFDVQGRTLITHAQDGIKDQGLSASFAFDPAPLTALGPSLTVRHDYGGAATGGLDALFAPEALDTRMGTEATGRWSAEAAWGLPAFRERFTGSPHLGVGLQDTGRDLAVGWRLAPAGIHAPDLSFDVKAMRLERAGATPDHGLELNLEARW